MGIKSPWVKLSKKHVSDELITHVIQFYTSQYSVDRSVPLKFRNIKGFFYDGSTNKFYWKSLHNLANKRTFTPEKLVDAIQMSINKGFVPLRLFYSSTQWLEPRRMGHRTDYTPVMIGDGIVVLESDKSLSQSLEDARKVSNFLSDYNLRFVYTGNKSIHIWIMDFDDKKWLNTSCDLLTNQAQWLARKNLFEYITKEIDSKFDHQTTIDIRRMIPMIGTLNGFTLRKVTEIPQDLIGRITEHEIIQMSAVGNMDNPL